MKKSLKIVLFSVLLSVISLGFFVPNITRQNDKNINEMDFDTFSRAVIDMVECYKPIQNIEDNTSVNAVKNISSPKSDIGVSGGEIDSVAEIGLKEKVYTNRLIIKSSKSFDFMGAIDVVKGYNNLYFLQYETEENMHLAFDKYSEMDFEYVIIDEYLSLEDVVIEEEIKEVQSSIKGINDSFSYSSWGAEFMGVESFSNHLLSIKDENQFENIYIAVLDTGIDSDHPWFTNRLALDYARDFSNSDTGYEDYHKHGTHVAGTICDLTLSNVKIIPVKVLGDKGSGSRAGIILGIEYVNQLKQEGLNIGAINMSLGGGYDETGYINYDNVFKVSLDLNINVIVAAGNESDDTGSHLPAAVDRVITVSALENLNNECVFDYSYSNFGQHVDFSAPGTKILSAYIDGTTISLNGTSMATPHVTGAVGLILSLDNAMTPAEIYELLKLNSIDLGSVGLDDYYGHGLVNVEYAYLNHLEDVKFSEEKTHVLSSFYLSLTNANADAEIIYTTDGSDPIKSATFLTYSEPIRVESAVQITARAIIKNNEIITDISRKCLKQYTINGEDIENAYTINNKGEITKYSGFLNDIIIPDKINGITPVKINNKAFTGRKINTVVLPDSITELGDHCFNNCYNLKSINLDNVTKLGGYAFENCMMLEEVGDTSNIKRIEARTFFKCKKLKKINLSNVEYVGVYSFYNCESLVSLDLSNVTRFGEEGKYGSFSHCYNLETITKLNSAVDFIPMVNFSACYSLRDEFDLTNVKVVGDFAFYDCSNAILKNYTPTGIYDNDTDKENNIKRVGVGTFVRCNIQSFDLSNVEEIGDSCFYGALFYEDLNIENVKSFERVAFAKAMNISELTLNCEFTGEQSFANIQDLKKVTFTNTNYITLTEGLFSKCNNLSEINIPTVKNIESRAIYQNRIQKLELPAIETIDDGGLDNCNMNNTKDGYNSIYELYLGDKFKMEKAFAAYGTKIYGYSNSEAKDYVDKYSKVSGKSKNCTFIPIDLNITNFGLIDNQVKVEVTGYKLNYEWHISNSNSYSGSVIQSGDNNVLQSTQYDKYYYVKITDWLGKTVTSSIYKLVENSNFIIKVIEPSAVQGKISQTGDVMVPNGEDYTFTITANYGYKVEKLIVDGVDLTSGDLTQYTFENVNSNHTLEVVFSAKDYTVSFYSAIGDKTDRVVTYHTYYNRIPDPSKEGYYFCGWVREDAIPEINSLNLIEEGWAGGQRYCEGDISYYAVYCKDLFINFGNQSVEINLYYPYDVDTKTQTVLVENIEKKGYNFLGFSTTENGELEFASNGSVVEVQLPDFINQIYALYQIKTYRVTVSVNNTEYGNVDVNNENYIEYLSNFKINFLTHTGSIIKNIKIDNIPLSELELNKAISDNFIILKDIEKEHSILIEFDRIKFTITTRGNDFCGSISPRGITSVDYGSSITYTFTPYDGFYIDEIIVDNVNMGSINEYTFTNVMENHIIVVWFETLSYRIVSSTGENGTISPGGVLQYGYNETQTYEIIPDENYKIKAIYLDNVLLAPESERYSEYYTFTNIKADHVIRVEFEREFYLVDIAENSKGSIIGSKKIEKGKSASYEVYPIEGYRVKNVVINGVSLGGVSNFNITEIDEDYEIYAQFDKKFLTCALFTDNGGNIECLTDLDSIGYGEDREFIIRSNDGYVIDKIFVNGQKVKVVNNRFKVINITENLSIQAVFKETSLILVSESVVLILFLILGLLTFILLILYTVYKRKYKNQKRVAGNLENFNKLKNLNNTNNINGNNVYRNGNISSSASQKVLEDLNNSNNKPYM